jgi:hypothetical protein
LARRPAGRVAADPREDVEVLLDTNRYSVFAVKQDQE